MLLTLKGEVNFTSTGKTYKFDHEFEKGLTAITGPNESGKSLRIEMIRFAWFGTKALRSVGSSYGSISVESSIKMGENIYKVTRSSSMAKLFKNSKEVVNGTKAVNAAIVKLFGYDLEVFDTANACLQDDVTAMTNKTPAERKRMIDRTIGLDAIDQIIKETTEQLNGLRQALGSLEKTLPPELIPPSPIEGGKTIEQLEAELSNLLHKNNEKVQILTELKTLEAIEPPLVAVCPYPVIETLYNKKEERNTLQNKISLLKNEVSSLLNRVVMSDEDIKEHEDYVTNEVAAQWEAYDQYIKEISRLPKDWVDKGYTDEDYDNMSKVAEYMQIEKKAQELEKNNKVNCPHCNGNFSLNHTHVDELRASIPNDFDFEKYLEMAEDCEITLPFQATVARDRNNTYRAIAALPVVKEPTVRRLGTKEGVELILAKQEPARQAIALGLEKQVQLSSLQAYELDAFDADLDEQIRIRKEYDQKVQRYENALERYNKYVDAQARLLPRLEELSSIQEDYKLVELELSVARKYEADLKEYKIRNEQREKTLNHIDEVLQDIDTKQNVRAALNALKPKVKSYLVPSLARVSSNFLSQMTNNVRNRIDITEDFEIIVDGQPVETLSGSGKAVANLAVRLGLGTVLTNKVFSVFMADEIDAAMDKDRADYTAQCLKNLTAVYNQIILVSHKKPSADNYIEL